MKINMKIKKDFLKKIGFLYCILYSLTRAFLGAEFGQLPFALFILVMSIYILLYFFHYSSQIQKITKDPFFGFYFIYLIFIVINLVICKRAYWYALYEYIFYLLMFFATCYYLTHYKFSDLLSFYEIIGVVLAIEAMWEFTTGNIPYRVLTEPQAIRRACGLLGTPLTLGIVLACITLISYFRASKTKKMIHYLNAVICFIGLLMTQSRGPLVGFICSYLVMIFLIDYQKTGKLFNSTLKNVLIIIISVVILFLIINILNGKNDFVTTIYNRIQSIFMWTGEDYSNTLRRNRWKIGLDIFLENPVMGYGVSSTGNHAITGLNVESGVIKKLSETGLVGFLLYYIMFISTIIRCLKRCIKSCSEFYPIAIAIIIAIFIENLVLQSIESVAVFLLFIISFSYLFIEGKGQKITNRNGIS